MKYCLQLRSVINEKYAGETLIESLARRFTYQDRDYWLGKIASGEVLVDGRKGEPAQQLCLGEEIQFAIPEFYEPDLDTCYHKIWENEHLILVSKPADLPVHSNHRFFHQTMTALVRRDENLPDINPIHRLDRETSGLMVYLKKPFKEKRLRRNTNLVIADKYYLALVEGSLPGGYLMVEAPLKEAGCPPVGYKMVVAEDGRPSQTEFFNLGSADGFTLLLARLGSGRKHQIRAHLQHAGLPIVGDKLYAHDSRYFIKRCNDDLQPEDIKILRASHHLLHAWALVLDLPAEGRRVFHSEYFSAEYAVFLQKFPGWQARADAVINAGLCPECNHP